MLTEAEIRKATPRDKAYKLTDIGNLYLFVQKSGAKIWKYRYRGTDGRDTMLVLGRWPSVSLSDARAQSLTYKSMRERGNDPVQYRELRKGEFRSFSEVADEWMEAQYIHSVTEKHAREAKSRLERFVYPTLGQRNVKNITDQDVIGVLLEIQSAKKIQTMYNTKYIISSIFKYAKSRKYVTHNPVSEIERGALLAKPRAKHFASFIKEADIRDLLRSFTHIQGHPWIEPALWFSIYTFARPGEIRHAEWSEFDDDFTIWVIPGPKMKERDPFIVPLARQVTMLVRDLLPITGNGPYLFPAAKSGGKKPMSDMTINAVLGRLGYTTDQITAHGFRGTASTALRAHNIRRELVELQLDHRDDRSTERSYNHADFLPDRRDMMQWWADYLDSLRNATPEPPVPEGLRYR